MVLGALAVLILAITWFVNKKSEDNLIAAAKLSQIVPAFEQGQFQKAIDGEPGTQLEGFKSIVENLEGPNKVNWQKFILLILIIRSANMMMLWKLFQIIQVIVKFIKQQHMLEWQLVMK